MMPAKTWNQRRARLSHSRIEKSTLAPTIGGVSVGAQQERNVKVRIALADLERDLDDRIESLGVLAREVGGSVEHEAVESSRQLFARKQLRTTAVGIGAGGMQRNPAG